MGAVRKEPMVERRAFTGTACGLVAAAVAIVGSLHGARAQARADQGYPERTVRIIVPTAAGGWHGEVGPPGRGEEYPHRPVRLRRADARSHVDGKEPLESPARTWA
jgi:hypothetical protein